MLDIVAHGTLATIDDDGNPLGTYASYVLDTKASQRHSRAAAQASPHVEALPLTSMPIQQHAEHPLLQWCVPPPH